MTCLLTSQGTAPPSLGWQENVVEGSSTVLERPLKDVERFIGKASYLENNLQWSPVLTLKTGMEADEFVHRVKLAWIATRFQLPCIAVELHEVEESNDTLGLLYTVPKSKGDVDLWVEETCISSKIAVEQSVDVDDFEGLQSYSVEPLDQRGSKKALLYYNTGSNGQHTLRVVMSHVIGDIQAFCEIFRTLCQSIVDSDVDDDKKGQFPWGEEVSRLPISITHANEASFGRVDAKRKSLGQDEWSEAREMLQEPRKFPVAQALTNAPLHRHHCMETGHQHFTFSIETTKRIRERGKEEESSLTQLVAAAVASAMWNDDALSASNEQGKVIFNIARNSRRFLATSIKPSFATIRGIVSLREPANTSTSMQQRMKHFLEELEESFDSYKDIDRGRKSLDGFDDFLQYWASSARTKSCDETTAASKTTKSGLLSLTSHGDFDKSPSMLPTLYQDQRSDKKIELIGYMPNSISGDDLMTLAIYTWKQKLHIDVSHNKELYSSTLVQRFLESTADHITSFIS